MGPAQLHHQKKKSKIGNSSEEDELSVVASQDEYNTDNELGGGDEADPNDLLFNVMNAGDKSAEENSDSDDEDLVNKLEADFQMEDNGGQL